MMNQHRNPEEQAMEPGAMADQQPKRGEDLMEKAAKAKAAPIGMGQAIAAANNHVPGTVLEAEFEAEDDQSFWEVEIVTDDGTLMEVKVDSQTGAILSSEEHKSKYDQQSMRQGTGHMHQGAKGEQGCCEGESMEGGCMGGGCMKGHQRE
jgi:hypothetical protein